MVGGELPLSLPGCPLQPLHAVHGDGVAVAARQEVGQLLQIFSVSHQIFSPPTPLCCHLHEVLAAGEEPGGEPEQLPAALVAAPHRVVSQLLQDLAVDLVTQNLLRMNLRYFRIIVAEFPNARCVQYEVCVAISVYRVVTASFPDGPASCCSNLTLITS